MKKTHFYLLAFCFFSMGAIFTSCEKNDKDPIIGTWVNESSGSINGYEYSQIYKWVFNSENEGTYSYEQNGTIELTVSYTWEKSGEFYLLNYEKPIEDLYNYFPSSALVKITVNPENSSEEETGYSKVRISSLFGSTIIETENKEVLAIKE